MLGRGLQGIGAGGLVPATLALVADRWPPERRSLPLGVVGAVQEAGAVLGPLAGAAVLAVADWRAIFWLNLLLGLGLAVGVRVRPGDAGPIRWGWCSPSWPFVALALQLAAPAALAEDVTLGLLYVPVVPSLRARRPRWSWSPSRPALALVVRSLARRPARCCRCGACRGWPARSTCSARRWPSWRSAASCGRSPRPTRRRRSSRTARCCCRSRSPRPSPSSLHERRTADPVLPLRALRPAGAWGALVVNLLVGVALVAALVDVPLFARSTTTPGDQLGAALVLLRLLVAVPVGAVAGGWLCRTCRPAAGGSGGMALAAVAFA